MSDTKPTLFWRLHAEVVKEKLAELPEQTREIIINDLRHNSQEYRTFREQVNAETNKRLEAKFA